MSWGTISTSGPIASCRHPSATAPTTASTRPWAIPSRAVAGGGLHGAAESLLDFRQQAGGRPPQRDARDGAEPAMAGSAGEDRGHAGDGRLRDWRLLRPAPEVAGRTE